MGEPGGGYQEGHVCMEHWVLYAMKHGTRHKKLMICCIVTNITLKKKKAIGEHMASPDLIQSQGMLGEVILPCAQEEGKNGLEQTAGGVDMGSSALETI